MYNFTLSLTSAVDGGWWSTPQRGRASGPFWTDIEKKVACPHRRSIPGPSARSESLYRLSGSRVTKYNFSGIHSNRLSPPCYSELSDNLKEDKLSACRFSQS